MFGDLLYLYAYYTLRIQLIFLCFHVTFKRARLICILISAFYHSKHVKNILAHTGLPIKTNQPTQKITPYLILTHHVWIAMFLAIGSLLHTITSYMFGLLNVNRLGYLPTIRVYNTNLFISHM